MHSYRPIKDKWEVGIYLCNFVGQVSADEWVMLSVHDSERGAIQRVNALNGGDGQPYLHGEVR